MSYETAIRDELAHWPGVGVEFSKRAKHRQAVFSYSGATRFVVLPETPSDWRGPMNSLRDVRKELVALGASRLEKGPTARVRKGRARPRVDRSDWMDRIERAPVKPNPFDVLAKLQFAPEPAPPTRWQRLRDWLRSWI